MLRFAFLRRLAPGLGIAALLVAALAFLGGDYSRRAHAIALHTALGSTDAAGVPIRPAGDTHDLALPIASMDAHWWLLHTEQFAAQGRPVRHTDRDNAPAGREVHWSSSISLGLVGVGAVVSAFSNAPLHEALPLAALWLGPLLLVLTLTGLALVTWRRLGGLAATLFVAILASSPGFVSLFAPGEADHHGLAVAFSLLAAWLPVIARDARRDFAAAGIAGALALWVSASTAIPVIAAIGLGGLLDTIRRHPPSAPQSSDTASRWRTWGRWGAATSLILYAAEYLPAHAGWRLEVNHPLHALAWWGGAEWLARLVSRLDGAKLFPAGRDLPAAFAQAILFLAPAVLVLVGGERFFHLGDPLLHTLHVDYIHEFSALPVAVAAAGVLALPLLWFAVLPAAGLLWIGRRSPGPERAPIAQLFVPACIALGLTCWQIRWQGLATALCAALAVATWSSLRAGTATIPARRRQTLFSIFLACACLQFPLMSWLSHDRATPDRAELASLVVRDVAWALREVADPARAVVLGGPTTSTQLAWFGGWRVLGTLYWENLDGLRASAAIFGEPDADTALRLCRERGVTHLVLFSWDDFASAYARLHRLETGATPSPDCLASRLATGRIPHWLRPIDYDIPPPLGLSDQRVLIYEIVPEPPLVPLNALDAASR